LNLSEVHFDWCAVLCSWHASGVKVVGFLANSHVTFD
jgi:hypothetical protein